MVSKKFWEKPINDFIKLLKNVTEETDVEILRKTFRVFPGVFSPIYSSDTSWFAEKVVPLTKNKKFLEIGSGSGIIACLAALNGALNTTATDINPKAIKNILYNSERHSIRINIREGSVFDPIDKDELFDIVFWNHPFYYTKEKNLDNDMIFSSVCDVNYQFLDSFFKNGRKYLTQDGLLLLGTSNVASLNLIKTIAKENGYVSFLLEKVEVPIYKEHKVKMDLRVLSFKEFTIK